MRCLVKYLIKPHNKYALGKTPASTLSVSSTLHRGKIINSKVGIFQKTGEIGEMFSKQMQNMSTPTTNGFMKMLIYCI